MGSRKIKIRMSSQPSALTAAILLGLVIASSQAISGGKKGVCFEKSTFNCGDFDILNGMNWFYTWGKSGDLGCGREEANFVPMLWNDAYDEPPYLPYATVLGFNEPNFGEQANMSPQRAAESWIRIQKAYPDKELVAPAAAPGGSNMSPTDWFDQFFAACDSLGGCRVDYLATHSYSGCVDCDMGYLEDLYSRYGRKIWFTEFAVPNTEDVGKVFDYMGSMLYHLEEAEFVARYSWFMAKWSHAQERIEDPKTGWYLSSINSLFVPGTSELTALGRFYNEYTHKK